jgi:type II secretory pathway predicted ATPase ExeA
MVDTHERFPYNAINDVTISQVWGRKSAMRIFNTSGPCDPARHYTVMREELVGKGQALVEQGRYFTIFAPRQAGKTTYFQLLLRQLQTQGYTPIWISFEGLKTLARPKFYQAFHHRLEQEFTAHGIVATQTIEDQFDLQLYLEQVSTQSQTIVLIIDEFEDVPDEVLSELMHLFRALYQKRQFHKLHALVLVGVSTIAELVLSSASPFNVVDELRIPYFSFAEVQALLEQHHTETGQRFDQPVIEAIYANTTGQPGLVCALCQYLVTVLVPDRSQSVTMDAFYSTLKHFLTERFDKNIVNIVQKAREKQDFMLRVLFSDTSIPFTVDNPDIAYLYAHGVVGNREGEVDVLVPLYSKRLIAAFRPAINGEAQYFSSGHDTFRAYVTADGLDLTAILNKYRDYVERRGFHAFDTTHLKEGAWHYSLDGFINFFLEQLGGETFVEVPSGRGRTDILILHGEKKYIIETKIFTTQTRFKQGQAQLADYLATEGVTEGYYVVFSNKHERGDTLYFDEQVDDKRIHSYIIRTQFDQPSRRRAEKSRRGQKGKGRKA